jgi:hypothetical protein
MEPGGIRAKRPSG